VIVINHRQLQVEIEGGRTSYEYEYHVIILFAAQLHSYIVVLISILIR